MKQLRDGAFGKMDGSATAKVPALLNFIEEMSSDTDSAIQPGQTPMALAEVSLIKDMIILRPITSKAFSMKRSGIRATLETIRCKWTCKRHSKPH